MNGYVVTFRQLVASLDVLCTDNSCLSNFSWDVLDTTKQVITFVGNPGYSTFTVPLPILIANQNDLQGFVGTLI